jgi:anti-anti-sigma factor
MTGQDDGTADTPGSASGGHRPGPAQELAGVVLQDRDSVTVATVTGEIDMSSVDRVAAALTDISNLAMGLVVDLRGVDYLDSSGISLLHDLAVRLRRRTQMLVIVCPTGSPPRRMLEITALVDQAVVLDELQPAIDAIRSAYAEGGGGENGRT